MNEIIEEKSYHIRNVTEVVEHLDPNIIYVVVEKKQRLHAALLCPCGCKSQILLNLLSDSFPYWRIRHSKKNGVTISPSIWKTNGCKSHFFIRKGKLLWVKNYSNDYFGLNQESFSIRNS